MKMDVYTPPLIVDDLFENVNENKETDKPVIQPVLSAPDPDANVEPVVVIKSTKDENLRPDPSTDDTPVEYTRKKRGPKVKSPGEYTVPDSFDVFVLDDEHPKKALYDEVISQMRVRNVKFRFKNSKGNIISTIGTLRTESVPTDRMIAGRRKPRKEGYTVFYDVRHGMFRQFEAESVIDFELSKKDPQADLTFEPPVRQN